MSELPAGLASALADRYQLERELGSGGMATVYLAGDLKHGRRVAIKVLRPELAAVIGAERFVREIRTIAALQHPHILGLIDSGEVHGTAFYVMPYVEGESLRDRLNREKQLPIPEAIRIASEVAGALDYAHRHGVIHRDVKPENVMLHDGAALVTDFGIALAVSSAGATRMTETGMSLGTPHYMSPEQAMGEREITARSDVYALGAMAYEMLVGEPPFSGPTAQSIVAKVLTEEPRPLIPRRHTIPAHVESAVMVALEKLPADRFATAADFAQALAGVVATTSARIAAAEPRPGPWRARFWVAAAVAVMAVGLAALGWMVGSRDTGGVSRQFISPGPGMAVAIDVPSLAISPDGATLVLVDTNPSAPLYVKQRDQLTPVPVPGTEGGTNPVFSPDGEWVAFIADGKLRKVRLRDGGVVTIADSAGSGFGAATWLEDNTLVFTSQSLLSLLRVGADGGQPEVVLADTVLFGLGAGQPVALPSNRGVMFRACASGCNTMALHVLDLKTGEQKRLLEDVAQAWYIGDGRLFYLRRDGVGLVAPFDLDRLELGAPATPVVEGILIGANGGFPLLAVSASGALVYLFGTGDPAQSDIARVTRTGQAALIDSSWSGTFTALAASHDGRRVAVAVGRTSGGLNIWVKQLDRGPFTRITFSGRDRRPVWSPDGRRVAFIRDTSANVGLVMAHASDGSGDDQLLARFPFLVQEVEWSPDGQWIVARTDNGDPGAGDLVAIRIGDTTVVPLVSSPYTELHPALSPDSRWLAYSSNESGNPEVYVRPFPNTRAGRWQVSVGGGQEPRWSRDGKELYFRSGNRMVAARVSAAGQEIRVDGIEPLFGTGGYRFDGFHQIYDVLPDGRFLLLTPQRSLNASGPPLLARVDNWFADLDSRLSR